MAEVKGMTTVFAEKLPAKVLIQSPTDTFRTQLDGSILPASILLTSLITNIEHPVYEWSYNQTGTWIKLSGQTGSTLTVSSGTWTQRYYMVSVTGYTTSARTVRSNQDDYFVVSIQKLPYDAAWQAELDTIKSTTDKIPVSVNGSLLMGSKLFLRNPGDKNETGQENAGVNGSNIPSTLPAFWGGGTYAEALRFVELLSSLKNNTALPMEKIANFIIAHDGSGMFGKLIVDENGRVSMLNPLTKKPFFIIDDTDLPNYGDLYSAATVPDVSITLTARTITPTGWIWDNAFGERATYRLPGILDTTKTGGKLTITLKGILTGFQEANSGISMKISLLRDGVHNQEIYSKQLSGYSVDTNFTENVDIAHVIEYPSKASYQLLFTFYRYNRFGDTLPTLKFQLTPSGSMLWKFNEELQLRDLTYIGKNGFMSFFDNGHVYFTPQTGLLSSTVTPGVFCSFSCNYDSYSQSVSISNKIQQYRPSDPAISLEGFSGGAMNIHHYYGKPSYTVHVNPHTPGVTCEMPTPGYRHENYTQLKFYKDGVPYPDSFDFTLIGMV